LREKEFYEREYALEKAKNLELEKEFMVLRSLITESQKPIGADENLMLRNQYQNERALRINAEQEISLLRQ
jgi:hypothetical protein